MPPKKNNSQIKLLKGKIGILKASLLKIDTFINDNEVPATAEELTAKLNYLESLLPKFEDYYFQLMELGEVGNMEGEEEDNEDFLTFEENYYTLREIIKKKIKESGSTLDATADNKNNCKHGNQDLGIKTPVININKFDGRTEEWTRFYENFKAIIHDNPNAGSNIRKFHYLVSLLENEAANLIDGIEISDENYNFAWEKLVNHYKNNKTLVETHMGNLFELKSLDVQTGKGLRELHNTFVKNINALKKLNVENLDDNIFLVYLLTSKLDKVTLKAWEETTAASKEMPKYECLEQFIVQQYNYLEAYEKKCETKRPDTSQFKRKSVTLFAKSNQDNYCTICKAKWHPVYKCQSFLSKSVDGRREIINAIKCCWQCLSTNHKVSNCSGRQCSKCSGKHNYLVCNSNKDAGKQVGQGIFNSPVGQGQPSSSRPNTSINCCLQVNKSSSATIFPTCLIYLKDKNGQLIPGRFLLDSASELNFINKCLADKLMLDFKKDTIDILGIGNARTKTSGFISTFLKSRIGEYSIKTNLYIVPEITQIDNSRYKIADNFNIPEYLKEFLADPDYCESNRKIDGILGAGLFFDVMQKSYLIPKITSESHDCMLKTALGWVICGNIPLKINNTNNSQCFMSYKRIKEDIRCEQHFLNTISTHSDGRFVVSLPFKTDPTSLGNSIDGAKKRFFNLEKKLQRDPALQIKYNEFIKEYINLGHMELLLEEEIYNWPNYYLPHHAIFKESSTTSLRIVFDGSFKTSNGLSLNDILMPGPALQNDVFDILTAFRIPKYGLVADIGKMYRQIWVDPQDRDLQRIVWREFPNDELQHFRLLTVTYGTRSAPYAAIRCLHYLADNCSDFNDTIQAIGTETNFNLSQTIKRKFFMDDFLDGANTVKELIEKQTKIEYCLKKYGFELRKWCSNSRELMDRLNNDIDRHYCINLSENDTIKALGLVWNPKTDNLIVKVHEHNVDNNSKRKILSDLHSFWDPVGLLIPVFIKGRIFLQELWQSKITWDEILPPELNEKWMLFRKKLQLLDGMRIPRRVLTGDPVQFEFHGFSDASEKAYGACIYVRACNTLGEISSHLICAKSRVAPLDKQTLPRLELQAALVLAELMTQLKNNLNFPVQPTHYWTDSEIVLAWINGEPQQWKTYVANRVTRIVELTKRREWHHVSSKENPADLLSRGVNPSIFNNLTLWWHGPEWLLKENHGWACWSGKCDNIIEQRKVSYTLIAYSATSILEMINKYSTWRKLYRVMAWVLRYINNLKGKVSERKLTFLSVSELKEAKLLLIKAIQNEDFKDEISRLKNNKPLSKTSKLLSLNPFIDDLGILRVGGRLLQADIAYDRKFPIILPYKSRLTQMILTHVHERHFHPGPQALLTIVRAEYWPINGKSAAKAIFHSCVTCRKASPKPVYPKMADLPFDRVNPCRPFEITGIDFCGPIYIKIGTRRSTKRKAYVAVFVCFITKAISLELVTDLSSQSFLAALHRFFYRHGTSRRIYSDNGTNFVGAQKELKKLVIDPNIQENCADQGVEWRFIPPGSPHFGGLWESSVKLLKFHLKRTMGKMIMTYEEAMTLLLGIEACLNSRPLSPLSDNPNDPYPLTPAHFMLKHTSFLPPEPDLSQIKTLTKRWDRVHQFMNQLWQRWSYEYLSSLQERHKWRYQHNDIPIGTLVAVKEENLKPCEWRMARVVTLHPGKDGISRVATIQLGNGHQMKRPLVKLCPILEEINAIPSQEK